MFIFRIRTYWHQAKRVMEIMSVLMRQGFLEYLSHRPRLKRFIGKATHHDYTQRTTQERIRLIIEDLGPTYIKFGQILADRPDVVSETLRRELKKLQSTAKPIDDNSCLAILEKELGQKVEDVFLEFDKRHIASASIGQTYLAKLKTGERVVIKVQRPNIAPKIKLDLKLMKILVDRTAKNYPQLAFMDLDGIVEEFGDTIIKEMNYLNEASNIMRFNEMFKTNPDVYIPRVFSEFSTHRVLVMEFVDGLPPDDAKVLEDSGLDTNAIALNGAHALLQMIFVHGYFHADPHPGNLFIMRNNVVGFIDFGMVGTLKPSHMDFLAGFILGFARNDSKMITRALLQLSGKKFYEYSEELEFEVEDLIKRNSYLPYERMDFSQLLMECVQIVLKYKLKIPSSIYLLLKALATIQRFAENLHPTFSFSETVLPYAKQMVKRKYSPKKMVGQLYNTIGDYMSLVRNLPVELNAILMKAKDGKLVHEINLHDSKPVVRLVRVITQRLALALLIAALIICSTVLLINDIHTGFTNTLFAISISLALILILKYLFKTRL